MAEENDALSKPLADILTKLRTTSEYDNVLGTLAENLNLSGAPAAAMKALLIHIVLDTFGTSISAEVVLVGLGLLQGYNNQYQTTCSNTAKDSLKERRIKFLQESCYLEGRLNGTTKERYTSFEDVAKNGKTAIETVVNTLGSNDGKRIKEVAKVLYNKTGLAQYLEESVKLYGIVNGNRLVDVKLPVLRYPRTVNIMTTNEDADTQTASSVAPVDNTASSQEEKQAETPNSAEASSEARSATSDSDASGPVELGVKPELEPEPETGSRSKPNPEPDPAPAPSEEKVPLAAKLLQRFRNLPILAKIGIFSTGALLIVLPLIVYFVWYLPQRSNVIQEIMVLNPYLELSPGDYGRLLIAAIGEDPDLDPDLSSLQCHSNDNPLITTAKVNDWAEGNDWTMTWYVLAAQDWTADLPYNGSVSVEGGKAEKVTVPVYVVDEDDKGTRVDPADIPEFWDAADGVISRGEEG